MPRGIDGPCRRDERLADDEAAEHTLPADLRAHPAIEVMFQLLEIEYREEACDRIGHRLIPVNAECRHARAPSQALRENCAGWRNRVTT